MSSAQMLNPSVADSLLGDEGVVSLMSHPKMAAALATLKDDPSQYKRLLAEDEELARMMGALQGAMSEAETEEERAAKRAAEERGKVAREMARARDQALEAGKDGAWARAVSACDAGLRSAPTNSELTTELRALRARYADRLAEAEREAAKREDLAAAQARAELVAATEHGGDTARLEAAIATARSHGLALDSAVMRAQRRLVELLEQQSGERMRQMREQARLAAQQAAAAPAPPAPSAQGAPESDKSGEHVASTTGAKGDDGPADAATHVARDARTGAEVRAKVLSDEMLFELD